MRTELTNGTIRLRRYATEEDAHALFEAAVQSAAEVGPWMTWYHAGYSLEDSRAWVLSRPQAWERGSEYDFRIDEVATGRFLGGCGLNAIDTTNRRANLGYWVRTGATCLGVATTATRLLAELAFTDLHLLRVEILVCSGNRASLRVAEKARAHREGVQRNRLVIHGQVHDAVMHSLIPGDL